MPSLNMIKVIDAQEFASRTQTLTRIATAAANDNGRLGRQFFVAAFQKDCFELREKGNSGLLGVFNVVRRSTGSMLEAVTVATEELMHQTVYKSSWFKLINKWLLFWSSRSISLSYTT